MGLGGAGRHVVHARWSEHHRPTATGAMTAECVITRAATTGPGSTTADDGTWTPATPDTIYTGPCRVTSPPFTREQVVPAGQAQQTERRYGVFVEWDADEFLVDDQVEILSARDPLLPGKVFRVTDVAYGSEQWQRNLTCEEVEAIT
jgi:hypothetical protein